MDKRLAIAQALRGQPRDTLKPYQPTARNRIASALMGNAPESSLWGHFVNKLVGPQVGRPSGMTVADFTPLVGTLLQANEAGRDLGTPGQRVQGGANLALAAIPLPAAAKGGKMVEDALAKGVKTFGKPAEQAAKPPIIAYHGSPHDFDAFSTAHIGSGEGAQAYGHGLYFSEKEGVAKAYRDNLTINQIDDGSSEFSPVETAAFRALRGADGNREAALAELNANLSQATREWEHARAQGHPAAAHLEGQIWKYEDAIQAVNDGINAPGHMYQVAIDADPEAFLDWDKPLRLQADALAKLEPHRARIEAELAKRGTMAQRLESAPGSLAYDALTGANAEPYNPLAGLTKTLGQTDRGFPQMASDTLREAGIPGIKYLDQGSRGAGEGSRNFVVFNDAQVRILKKYGWVPGMAIPAAAAAELHQANQRPAPGL